MNEKYDVIIIGAGPAGLTAAIYASRANPYSQARSHMKERRRGYVYPLRSVFRYMEGL